MNIAEEVIASALCAAEIEEPKTMDEARKRPDASKWLQAAQEEMNSLIEHDTWSLIKLPSGRKIVGSNGFSRSNTMRMVRPQDTSVG